MTNVAAQPTVRMVGASGQSVEAVAVYTVSQLSQQCAQVLEQINASGRPAAVTRHGKFVAMITPLAGSQVESVVLSEGPLAAEYTTIAKEALADESTLWSSDDVARLLGAEGDAGR